MTKLKSHNSANVLRILNLSLHAATLGTRFLFIFFLAKYLDPASVGYYGLFTAAVGYAMYFVGLDFYTYVTREVIKTPITQRGQLLKSQAALSGVLYLFFLPFAVTFLNHSGWPGHLVWWFFPILLLEHFNQEMSRFLVAMSEQITGSVILFVRQGSWALVIVLLMTLNTSNRNLDVVMALWVIAGVAAALIGIWKLRQLRMGGWKSAVNWGWVKSGIRVSVAFLLATLALRGMQTIDRYWLQALGGIEMVGAYVILLGVAGTLMTFLDAGIFAYAYPALIKLYHQQDFVAAHAKTRQMLVQTLALSAAFALISWIALPLLLSWIDNPIYQKAQNWYPWLLLAMVLNALSMVPHFALYASGQDKHIIFSHIGALAVFALAVWVLKQPHTALAVPMALNAAFGSILVWKTVAYRLENIKRKNLQGKSTPHALTSHA
jgi:O-antigen/teichoic acid export membrane protein